MPRRTPFRALPDLCHGVGSGKTAVLVERVLHLVRECRVPERIVAITLRRRRRGMKDRLRSECRDREHSGSQEEMSAGAGWRARSNRPA